MRIIAICVVAAMVCTLSACSSSPTSPAASVSPTSSGTPAVSGTPSPSGDPSPSGTDPSQQIIPTQKSGDNVPQWFEDITINGVPLFDSDVEIISTSTFKPVVLTTSNLVTPQENSDVSEGFEVEGRAGYQSRTKHFPIFITEPDESSKDSPQIIVSVDGKTRFFPSTETLIKDSETRSIVSVVSTPTSLFWIEFVDGGQWRLFKGDIATLKVQLLGSSKQFDATPIDGSYPELTIQGQELVLEAFKYASEAPSEVMPTHPTDTISIEPVHLRFSLDGKLLEKVERPYFESEYRAFSGDWKSYLHSMPGILNKLTLRNSGDTKLVIEYLPAQDSAPEESEPPAEGEELDEYSLMSAETLGFGGDFYARNNHIVWYGWDSVFDYDVKAKKLRVFTLNLHTGEEGTYNPPNVFVTGKVLHIASALFGYTGAVLYAYDLAGSHGAQTIVSNEHNLESFDDGVAIISMFDSSVSEDKTFEIDLLKR